MKKNFYAFLLGIFITVVLLAAVEGFFQLNRKFHWLQAPEHRPPRNTDWSTTPAEKEKFKKLKTEVAGNPIFQWKPLLDESFDARKNQRDLSQKNNLPCCMGRHPLPVGQQFQSKVYIQPGNHLVYDAKFTFDNHGRRITPVSKNPKYNIMLFGDSFTLGEGVHDEESTAFVLGKMRPEAQVYNFGIAGGSPNDILYELSEPNSERLKEIPRRKNIVIYSFIDHHPERLFCRFNCVKPENNWIQIKPYYASENGKVVFKGFFDQNRAIRNSIYTLLAKSALLEFIGFEWPLRFGEKEFEFFADVLVESRKQAEARFGDVDFYLALYPNASHMYASSLRKAAEARGIQVLDYSKSPVSDLPGWIGNIPGDGHPTPIAHYIYAVLLNRDLPKPK